MYVHRVIQSRVPTVAHTPTAAADSCTSAGGRLASFPIHHQPLPPPATVHTFLGACTRSGQQPPQSDTARWAAATLQPRPPQRCAGVRCAPLRTTARPPPPPRSGAPTTHGAQDPPPWRRDPPLPPQCTHSWAPAHAPGSNRRRATPRGGRRPRCSRDHRSGALGCAAHHCAPLRGRHRRRVAGRLPHTEPRTHRRGGGTPGWRPSTS